MGDTAKVEAEMARRRAAKPPTPEEQLQQAAMGLIQQTDPLRTSLISRSEEFLGGGDVTSTPEFMAMKQMTGQQSDMAKDRILETMPSGGVLLDKLADVDIDRARTLSMAGGSIYGDEMNRAVSLATGAPLSASMGGLGALTQLEAAREQAEAQRDAGTKSGIGGALGAFLGGK